MQPKLLTITAAARELGLHANTCREMVADGRLPGTRIGARIYIARAALDRIEADAATPIKRPLAQPAPGLEVVGE